MLEIMVEDDKKSFIFEQKYNNIFIWGKEVNDFHILDKNMIFAIHHSAIQELSRRNDAKTEKIKGKTLTVTSPKALGSCGCGESVTFDV